MRSLERTLVEYDVFLKKKKKNRKSEQKDKSSCKETMWVNKGSQSSICHGKKTETNPLLSALGKTLSIP